MMTHGLNATGYSFNMMLMPELSIDSTRSAMENGTFYSVSRVSRVDGINATYPDGTEMRGSENSSTTYLLDQSTPSINNIAVDQGENSLTVEGNDYTTVEWIADGKVIATGNTIDLNDYVDQINSYVRAQLKSETGIPFTQPFSLTIQEPEAIEIEKADAKKNQANISFDVQAIHGKGYVLYLSEIGEEGSFKKYNNVNYKRNGVHIRGLERGKEYHAYVVFVEDNVITEKSEVVSFKTSK